MTNPTRNPALATSSASTSAEAKRAAARETLDILEEISVLLNTNLDRQSLTYCVSMIENGVNPEALAAVIKDLRSQTPPLPLTQGGQ